MYFNKERLNAPLVSFHAGFDPPSWAAKTDTGIST